MINQLVRAIVNDSDDIADITAVSGWYHKPEFAAIVPADDGTISMQLRGSGSPSFSRNSTALTQARADASVAEVESLIAQFGLSWSVIAAQDEVTGKVERPLNPDDVLAFLPDRVTGYDDQGNPQYAAVTAADLRDGTVRLPKYAGHADWVIQEV